MPVYINEKERTALLDACDFISTNADGAVDYSLFEEMQKHLMSLFHKAKADSHKMYKKRLVKKYLKKAEKNPTTK